MVLCTVLASLVMTHYISINVLDALIIFRHCLHMIMSKKSSSYLFLSNIFPFMSVCKSYFGKNGGFQKIQFMLSSYLNQDNFSIFILHRKQFLRQNRNQLQPLFPQKLYYWQALLATSALQLSRSPARIVFTSCCRPRACLPRL